MAAMAALKGMTTVVTRTVVQTARVGPIGSSSVLRTTVAEEADSVVLSERFLHWSGPLPADASVPEASASASEGADRGYDDHASVEHYAKKDTKDLYGKPSNTGEATERAANTDMQHGADEETLEKTGFDMSKMSRPAGDE
ncbi:hypothetical protein KFL_000980160 [Klebsormidium nitens]|uniref:Uncharacterized protein n=1 Tax=Klebsormidium nitens TaxID=105231 RepID=A0A0U9I774_KLENI|nr:hypothetical protein KFL_000980160 [Klebsormidium nitens]|eukprot:GAQ82029.1 hypothetical protein KFL_000980160 [Klebsormidium nitens]